MRKRVLVFRGGTEVGLGIFRALRYCEEEVMFSTSSGVKQHTPPGARKFRSRRPAAEPVGRRAYAKHRKCLAGR